MVNETKMTREDKNILLNYLCMALPHRVMIKSVGENKIIGLRDLKDDDNIPLPYLRPLSSMTEEEKKDLLKYIGVDSEFFEVHDDGSIITNRIPGVQDSKSLTMKWVILNTVTATRYVEWFLKKHFDYHRKYDEKDGRWKSMIEVGLALEALKGMYND